jgi:hypothetical protein
MFEENVSKQTIVDAIHTLKEAAKKLIVQIEVKTTRTHALRPPRTLYVAAA